VQALQQPADLTICSRTTTASVGCVQLLAVAHQGGVWVQAPRFFWSRRWAPPGIGCVRRPSSVRLCLRPPAVRLCPAVCVWPAGGGCAPPVTFKKKQKKRFPAAAAATPKPLKGPSNRHGSRGDRACRSSTNRTSSSSSSRGKAVA
jgi:hypothetical protein